jgi:hypothetical protein
MDQMMTTAQERDTAMNHLARLVTDAAMPDRDGKRMAGEDLTKLAEEAGAAIAAGMKKVTGGA